MGVRENIKNYFSRIFNQKKIKKLDAPLKGRNYIDGPISVSTSNKDEELIINEIKYYDVVNFNNIVKKFLIFEKKEEKILMLAKIDRKFKEEKEKSVLGENILFEVDQGTKIDSVLIKKIVGYYLHEKSLINNELKRGYYIGELNNDPQNTIKVKSKMLQRYVDAVINPKLPAPHYQFYKIMSNNFEESLRVNKSEAIPSISDNNVFLKQRILHDEEYEKKYHDYDGTKTDNGNVLRIRKLHKYGQANGRYLYTAFLSETKSKDDSEKVYSADEDPIGIPVCFTLDGRFEDIVKNQDPNEIRKILDMLSSRDTFDRNCNKLNYIGHLEKNGNVNRNLNDNYRVIKDNVEKMQEQYGEHKKGEDEICKIDI